MSLVSDTVALLRKEPANPNDLGNSVHRMFLPSERYEIDFATDLHLGWLQYDTGSDAHYFGVWVNPEEGMILAYAEGDWSLTVCARVDTYNAEIRRMNEFYSEGYEAKILDSEGQLTVYRQDRSKFLIGEA